MVFNPADVVHGYHNHTDRDVYLQIMLGRPRPEVPTYVEQRYESAKYDHLGSPLPLGEAGGSHDQRATAGEGTPPSRPPSPPSGGRG